MHMEEIIGGLEGLNLCKGVFRGYALYITNQRVIGAKMKSRGKELLKFLMGWRGSVRGSLRPLEWKGESLKVSRLSAEETSTLLEDIRGRIDFEVRKQEIEKVELKKPGTFRAGHVKIKARGGEHKVLIVAGAREEYEYLKGLFKEFCPEKVEVVE